MTEALVQIRENLKDHLEMKMFVGALGGDVRLLVHLSDRLMRDRGYGQVQRLEGSEGGPIQVQSVPTNLPNLDFTKIPLDKVRRFRDLLRKAMDPTALTVEELNELKEIRRLAGLELPAPAIEGTAVEVATAAAVENGGELDHED